MPPRRPRRTTCGRAATDAAGQRGRAAAGAARARGRCRRACGPSRASPATRSAQNWRIFLVPVDRRVDASTATDRT
uniref:Uncharacterized protein n=1 Tax=Arundo donax TaxID=35708 RepID=A0A0A9FA22_ARUDO